MKKLVVVTGATKGIGRAVVERFAKAGFDLAINARTPSDLQQFAAEIEEKYKVNVYAQATDMADRGPVKAFCEGVLSLRQPIEVLVNNAGYFSPGHIIDEQEGALEKMMNTNLFSAYHTTRGLVKSMIENRRGTIFNICSIASFMAYKNGGSYAITKFALLGFSKCLREELKEFGIRVTSVMPGATLTNSWEGVDLPPERFMKPEDVAETIFGAYSLSERSVVEEIVIRPMLGDI
jgi:short-subunit dehydrogenase